MDSVVNRREVLAIIPARGGSKGIPGKNIRNFSGYPLIAYSIAAGLQAKFVTRTIVSTDAEDIAKVAREWGAETPFIRPDEYAQDQSLDLPVFQHALTWLAEHEGYRPDVVVQLRPTSPVRPTSCVDEAVRILLDHPEADSVRGVVTAGQNPYKMWRINQVTGQMQPLLTVEGITEPFNAPRQVLPLVHWQTGHIDAIRTQVILEQDSMSGNVILPLVLESKFTVDIDNLNDWQRAEWLVKYGGLQMVVPGTISRPLPQRPRLMVMDFDGVLTDNRVWVGQDGKESVAANRGDSLGLSILREKTGMELLVLSKEVNPVVQARCEKMKVPYLQGIDDKALVLKRTFAERGIDPLSVIYIGNDVNDLPCFPLVGCALAPADAEPEVLQKADIILHRRGGHGAVREVCDQILNNWDRSNK
jgi:YrbI family 3-deoxy-D-manno-octulosonate 8-phosphate phosphatase